MTTELIPTADPEDLKAWWSCNLAEEHVLKMPSELETANGFPLPARFHGLDVRTITYRLMWLPMLKLRAEGGEIDISVITLHLNFLAYIRPPFENCFLLTVRMELAKMASTGMAKRNEPPPLEPREFRSPEEIDLAIAKLGRRIKELGQLDVKAAILNRTGEDEVAQSNARETIREVFGTNSPEFKEHSHLRLWDGPMFMNMSDQAVAQSTERGRIQAVGILNGLVGRLKEKQEDMIGGAISPPSTYVDRLKLHPRIQDVARDLFMDGHHLEAAFAASKALINFVKEKSGRHDLDGVPLVQAVFSRNNPILVFNDLSDKTDTDEQEGMMHLFEGVVLAIRNPGGHSFPEGTEQRAIEYISLISLLAYRVQESKRRK